MTASEAIEWLKGIKKKYIHGGDEFFDNARKIAISTAISALEKQIPKKATPHKVEAPKISFGNANWRKGTTVYKCPCCGTFISYCNYCNNCGQALDRSDTE